MSLLKYCKPMVDVVGYSLIDSLKMYLPYFMPAFAGGLLGITVGGNDAAACALVGFFGSGISLVLSESDVVLGLYGGAVLLLTGIMLGYDFGFRSCRKDYTELPKLLKSTDIVIQ